MKKVVAFSLFLSLGGAGAFAQAVAGLGAVAGSVRDATGASVPDATVVLSNESKGIRRTMQTTDAGVFTAQAIVPASGYSLTVTKQGFTKYEVKGFEVQVGQTVDFKVELQVGSATTSVDVTAEAPIVDSSKTDVSQVINSQQIQDLPINGRRVDSFVLLSPAVVADGTVGLVSFRGIAGGAPGLNAAMEGDLEGGGASDP